MKQVIVIAACLLVFGGCTTVQKGAAVGGAAGAAIGAIIGHQSGETAEGAVIGGAAGAITGAIVGEQLEVKFCPECGKGYTEGVKFCPTCGRELQYKKR